MYFNIDTASLLREVVRVKWTSAVDGEEFVIFTHRLAICWKFNSVVLWSKITDRSFYSSTKVATIVSVFYS